MSSTKSNNNWRGVPSGKTSTRWYATGYQSALDDILRAIEAGGIEGGLDWISNNSDRAAWAKAVINRAVDPTA